jgi:hypothetical protein
MNRKELTTITHYQLAGIRNMKPFSDPKFLPIFQDESGVQYTVYELPEEKTVRL